MLIIFPRYPLKYVAYFINKNYKQLHFWFLYILFYDCTILLFPALSPTGFHVVPQQAQLLVSNGLDQLWRKKQNSKTCFLSKHGGTIGTNVFCPLRLCFLCLQGSLKYLPARTNNKNNNNMGNNCVQRSSVNSFSSAAIVQKTVPKKPPTTPPRPPPRHFLL